ncbi:hypothetical protein SDC9_120640 [bioreactor metagenome]|uniref:Uncharacterized protein n=1 Tax=bioreactor metagenome TaxID=1076179 RepID=A0A645C829_9ZZZZ
MMRGAVGYDGGDGGLRACPGGGRHGKDWRQTLEYAERTAHLRDALPRLHDARAGGFCAVHRRTAAKGYDAIALVFNVELTRRFDVLDGRVGFYAVIDDPLYSSRIAGGKERIEKPKFSKHGICYDQHIPNALTLDKLRKLFDAARSG